MYRIFDIFYYAGTFISMRTIEVTIPAYRSVSRSGTAAGQQQAGFSSLAGVLAARVTEPARGEFEVDVEDADLERVQAEINSMLAQGQLAAVVSVRAALAAPAEEIDKIK